MEVNLKISKEDASEIYFERVHRGHFIYMSLHEKATIAVAGYSIIAPLNYRIPGHFIYMSLHKKATIVIYLVLQSTPTYVNAVAGYSIIAPKILLNFRGAKRTLFLHV